MTLNNESKPLVHCDMVYWRMFNDSNALFLWSWPRLLVTKRGSND